MASLLDIRQFLKAHDCAAAPWDEPGKVVERLCEILHSKKHDDRFWSDLRALMRRLDDRRFNADAMKGSEALKDATIDSLADELRRTLNGNGEKAGVGKWLAAPLTGTALLGFLVLGYSAGCDEDDSSSSSTADCQEAEDNGIEGSEAETYCQLVDLIESADIDEDEKTDLLECLPELSASYREFLLDKFQKLSAAELTSFLEGMLQNGGSCAFDDYGDDH